MSKRPGELIQREPAILKVRRPTMGSLISDMKGSDIVATLEVLSEHGVTARDLAFLRRYRKGFGDQVAEAIKSGSDLLARTRGHSLETSLAAVGQIEDEEILFEVFVSANESKVMLEATKRIQDYKSLSTIARWARTPDRWPSIENAISRLPNSSLEEILRGIPEDRYEGAESLGSKIKKILRERLA